MIDEFLRKTRYLGSHAIKSLMFRVWRGVSQRAPNDRLLLAIASRQYADSML